MSPAKKHATETIARPPNDQPPSSLGDSPMPNFSTDRLLTSKSPKAIVGKPVGVSVGNAVRRFVGNAVGLDVGPEVGGIAKRSYIS